jgi:RecB family endonuclease NucS
MNLPTREEAKEASEAISLTVSDSHTGRILNIRFHVQTALKILSAYSSGSLIEARTEGEIEKVIRENVDTLHTISDFPHDYNVSVKQLAHALVGKV